MQTSCTYGVPLAVYVILHTACLYNSGVGAETGRCRRSTLKAHCTVVKYRETDVEETNVRHEDGLAMLGTQLLGRCGVYCSEGDTFVLWEMALKRTQLRGLWH